MSVFTVSCLLQFKTPGQNFLVHDPLTKSIFRFSMKKYSGGLSSGDSPKILLLHLFKLDYKE